VSLTISAGELATITNLKEYGRNSGIFLSVLTKVRLRGTPLNLPNIRQNDWYEQIYRLLAILKRTQQFLVQEFSAFYLLI
jgi:hypothetical protein